ncbi:Protein of unknown function [Bacillus wiedmannii]|nr:Protein of unknown function [Bacillus wiedmannii]
MRYKDYVVFTEKLAQLVV